MRQFLLEVQELSDFTNKSFNDQLEILNTLLADGLTVKEIRSNLRISEKALQKIIKENGYKYDQRQKKYISNTEVVKSNINNESVEKCTNNQGYQNNTPVTFRSEEYHKLLQMIKNYDEMTKKLKQMDQVYEWYEKKILDENVIDIEIPKLEIPDNSEQKEIVTRSFKLYADVNKDFKNFCNRSNYKAQDIVSVALREFLDKYDKQIVGGSMIDTIQQVLSDIEGIKISLETIAQNGIPIIDTYAPITTWINIGTTIFATAFGGWITLQLFKRQERMRIREEIRLEFYKQYEEIYKLLLDEFIEYKEEVYKLSGLMSKNDKGEIRSFINSINDLILKQEDVKNNYESTMKESIKLITDIKNRLDKLEDFMDSKKTITGYYEYKYILIKKQIKEYEDNFGELRFRYNKLCSDSKMASALEKIGIEEESQIEDETKIKDEIQSYNKVLIKINSKNNALELLIKQMQDINQAIEKEFIGEYFEKKKVNFVIKYIKRFFKKIINSILYDEQRLSLYLYL